MQYIFVSRNKRVFQDTEPAELATFGSLLHRLRPGRLRLLRFDAADAFDAAVAAGGHAVGSAALAAAASALVDQTVCVGAAAGGFAGTETSLFSYTIHEMRVLARLAVGG